MEIGTNRFRSMDYKIDFGSNKTCQYRLRFVVVENSLCHKFQEIRSCCRNWKWGQYLMIFPEFNAVAVFTGGAYNSQEDKLPFAIINDVFLPMLLELKED